MNNGDLSFLGLVIVLVSHVLKELWLARDIDVVALFLDASFDHSLAQETEWAR